MAQVKGVFGPPLITGQQVVALIGKRNRVTLSTQDISELGLLHCRLLKGAMVEWFGSRYASSISQAFTRRCQLFTFDGAASYFGIDFNRRTIGRSDSLSGARLQ